MSLPCVETICRLLLLAVFCPVVLFVASVSDVAAGNGCSDVEVADPDPSA